MTRATAITRRVPPPTDAARTIAADHLRQSAAHTLAELTDADADLRTLAKQAQQSAGLALRALSGRETPRPDPLHPRP